MIDYDAIYDENTYKKNLVVNIRKSNNLQISEDELLTGKQF